MMILVQKLTLLAFSYYDGMQSDEKLNADQKFHAIKYIFYSYLLFFI